MTESAAKAEIADRAKKLCTEYGWLRCPICGTQHSGPGSGEALGERIGAELQNLAGAAPDPVVLEDLRGRVRCIKVIDASLIIKTRALELANMAVAVAAAQLIAAMPGADVNGDLAMVQTRIDELRRDAGALTREMTDSQGERALWARRVKDLDQELTFHKYRDRMEQLKNRLTEGLAGARGVLRQYQELLNTTRSLQEMLERAFDEALGRATPPLERMLTEVYQILTRQPSYDEVRIFAPPDQRRRRELRVASSHLPGQTFSPSVLNGQAAKALRLVPYFVFSRFQPEIMELDLLLIDDPSESFDTSHVSELVGELARVAQHAHVFVATHEREKFEPHFATHFGAEPPVELCVEGFTPLGGPKLERR